METSVRSSPYVPFEEKPINLSSINYNGYLFSYRLRQDDFLEKRSIKPFSLYQMIALIFALWGWLTTIGRESLKRYVGFQWGRAVVDKMFFYSRTKKIAPD